MKKAVAVLAAGFALLGNAGLLGSDVRLHLRRRRSGFGIQQRVGGHGQLWPPVDYGGFRWTQATGLVSLGRPQVGGGGGVPGISADGTRIGYSIGSLDSSYRTQGLWTLGSGWQELMPPPPPDGGTVDGIATGASGTSRATGTRSSASTGARE